jgi:hypothetical protein
MSDIQSIECDRIGVASNFFPQRLSKFNTHNFSYLLFFFKYILSLMSNKKISLSHKSPCTLLQDYPTTVNPLMNVTGESTFYLAPLFCLTLVKPYFKEYIYKRVHLILYTPKYIFYLAPIEYILLVLQLFCKCNFFVALCVYIYVAEQER